MRVDFGKVMERMRELRAKMSSNDSAKRFATMGVDVYQVMLVLDTACAYMLCTVLMSVLQGSAHALLCDILPHIH